MMENNSSTFNKINNQADVQNDDLVIKKAIKQLNLKEKLKAVALNHYLQLKKSLDKNLEQEIKVLQRKYDKLAAVLYSSSNEIIEGSRLPNEEELVDLPLYLNDEDMNIKNQVLVCKPITGYWFQALKNSASIGNIKTIFIAQEIREKDEAILQYLIKIEYVPVELSENFSLLFQFEENQFFHNLILKKTFILRDGENPIKSEGTIIEWQEGINVTRKKKLIKKGKSEKQVQEVDSNSFFNFFRSINLEDKDVIGNSNQEEMDKIARRMDIDYDLARMITDEIIPYSLEYYLGVKINDDYDDIEDFEGVTKNLNIKQEEENLE